MRKDWRFVGMEEKKRADRIAALKFMGDYERQI